MNDWWYEDGGGRHGPVTQAHLEDLLARGVVGPHTAVWTRAARTWVPLGARTEFSGAPARHAPPPAPLPPAHAMAPSAAPPCPAGAAVDADLPLAAPWARWCARMFDFWLGVLTVGFSAGILLGLYAPQLVGLLDARGASLLIGLGCVPLALLLDAAVTAAFGNSPGKALLGLRVTLRDGGRPGFGRLAWRAARIWAAGFALGVPLIMLLTMARQYRRLKDGGQASYDGDMFRVRAAPVGRGRRALFALGFVLVFLTMVAVSRSGEGDREPAPAPGATRSAWTNPLTGNTASIAPQWHYARTSAPDGMVMHRFTQFGEQALVVLSAEDMNGAGMDDYARAWLDGAPDGWTMEEGKPGQLRGRPAWTAEGHGSARTGGAAGGDGALRIRARLVQVDGTVWHMVTIQSAPMAQTDRLVDELHAQLWDTVLQR